MKTKTYQVYTFAELSPAAQENAIRQAQIDCGYAWGDDALASLKALAKHFDGKVKDYSVDWGNSSYSSADFDMPELEPEEIACRLAALGAYNSDTLRGLGDCVLTGFCADESAIDGFRKAWHAGERDLGKLMQAAFKEWLADAQSDYAESYKPEQYAEHADSNGYEYTEDGKLN